ncbi:hypothetical protein NMG60_11006388 [Bertholletia excelsa]
MLTITDYASNAERNVVVECKGHDAARFHNIEHAHGWEKDVVGMVEQEHKKSKISISFECETLKADQAAEDHIRQFLPKLVGMDAVVNIGRMSIAGLEFESEPDNVSAAANVERISIAGTELEGKPDDPSTDSYV